MKKNLVVLTAFLSLILTMTGLSVAVAQSGEDPAKVAAGEAVYTANCAGCHAADGTGTATGRPLTGIADQADRSVHVTSVTDGKDFMPAFGDRLSEEEIDSVVAYVRGTFVSAQDPLPRTGNENSLVIFGVALLAAGGALSSLGRRSETA